MDIKSKAEAFSTGNFESIYNCLASDAVWNIVGNEIFCGKEAIKRQCEQVSNYFKSVQTVFKTLHTIVEENKVAINGTAEFLRENQRISFVYACDLYEFNEHYEIKTITSYCIESK